MKAGAKLLSLEECENYGSGWFGTDIDFSPLWSSAMFEKVYMFEALIDGGVDIKD